MILEILVAVALILTVGRVVFIKTKSKYYTDGRERGFGDGKMFGLDQGYNMGFNEGRTSARIFTKIPSKKIAKKNIKKTNK